MRVDPLAASRRQPGVVAVSSVLRIGDAHFG
jgi:hypothetical protein